MTTHKYNVHVQSRTASVKWLAEIVHANWAPINTETAKRIGIMTGDLIRVESDVGYLVTKAQVTEGIHPKVTSISTACGHWGYGRLAQLKLKDKGGKFGAQEDPDLKNVWWDDNGVHPNQIIPAVADPIGGSAGWYDTVVKVTKAQSGDKYGDIKADQAKHQQWFKKTMSYTYVGDMHRKMHPEMASWAGPDSVSKKGNFGGH